MIKYNFKITVNRKGYHTKRCEISPKEYSKLESILFTFPIISELEWFKSEVLKAKEKREREYTGLNTFECHVTGDICELFHDFDRENTQKMPTDIVLEYIDMCIEFHKLYNSGGIPGIIPESKKDEWIIAPKEYFQKEYWKKLEYEEE